MTRRRSIGYRSRWPWAVFALLAAGSAAANGLAVTRGGGTGAVVTLVLSVAALALAVANLVRRRQGSM